MAAILLQDSACECECESSSETDSKEVSIRLIQYHTFHPISFIFSNHAV